MGCRNGRTLGAARFFYRVAISPLQNEIGNMQQDVTLQLDTEIRLAVAVDVARKDGIAAAEAFPQLSRPMNKMIKIVAADEGETRVAGELPVRVPREVLIPEIVDYATD
jgi:hypothetical protein